MVDPMVLPSPSSLRRTMDCVDTSDYFVVVAMSMNAHCKVVKTCMVDDVAHIVVESQLIGLCRYDTVEPTGP